jgi:hypothetical protein
MEFEARFKAAEASLDRGSTATLTVWQALQTRATRKELQGDYDAAFALYIDSAQSYVALTRQADSGASLPSFKDKCRHASIKAVQRAEKIKGLRRHLKAARPIQGTDAAQQDILLQSESLPCGRARIWTEVMGSQDHLLQTESVEASSPSHTYRE